MRYVFGQKQSAHHRNISQREEQGAHNRKTYGLRHRSEHLALDADERQNRDVDNENNYFAKSSTVSDTGSGNEHFLVHFSLGHATHGFA